MSLMSKEISLIDLAYRHPVDTWVVFMNIDKSNTSIARSSLWRLLKPGFQHVEVWKRMATDFWIRCDPSVEIVDVQVYGSPPWQVLERLDPTTIRVRRVIAKGYWRVGFHIGPMSCVELTKAFLGIAKFSVRTPWQLYNFLRKENG